MLKKLEKRIKNIKRTIDTKDYEFEEIYDSKAGKIFSNHIKETGDFCQKYFFIPMLGSFGILIQKILQWTQTEEYNELIKEKVKDEKDEEMLRLFHEYQKIEPNWLEDTGLDYFTDEKEQMRFIAYLTVTTVSYFEIFVRNTIDEVQDKLLKNYDYYTNKYGLEIKNILKNYVKYWVMKWIFATIIMKVKLCHRVLVQTQPLSVKGHPLLSLKQVLAL